MAVGSTVKIKVFLSTPSARRATTSTRSTPISTSYFYPRPPRGGRPMTASTARHSGKFLSTPSARRATIQLYQFGHPYTKFLSTPSARRATSASPLLQKDEKDFYPRPPRGGRLLSCTDFFLGFQISIHALREEGDVPAVETLLCVAAISIHALREEGDATLQTGRARHTNFYPRPPRGGRRERVSTSAWAEQFLSTPSARRATWPPLPYEYHYILISIHALREEGDWATTKNCNCPGYFYPRPPRGGRPRASVSSGCAN